jgi:hypothetical protein
VPVHAPVIVATRKTWRVFTCVNYPAPRGTYGAMGSLLLIAPSRTLFRGTTSGFVSSCRAGAGPGHVG